MEDMINKYNVSRETIDNLKLFQNMVLEWNKKFNLISKSSEKNIWERHIVDSLQLCQFININQETLYDFGSGAGFPGIVLAIAGKQSFPNLKITLIESVGKKVLFLKEVDKVLDLNLNIINDRIENIKLPKADIISSRAMASLEKLLEYAKPFCSEKTILVFPKGEKWQEEIDKAKENWVFNYKSTQSITNNKGCILSINKIRRK
jgi:16S rRNA (guanine527-N7)-methyltransferase